MVEFGRFGTLADGRPVNGRAFDALIEASGAVVGKDELVSRVWRNRIVDENQ
jgi:DNA-binding winged helix-turn-helix (wHTH) protein